MTHTPTSDAHESKSLLGAARKVAKLGKRATPKLGRPGGGGGGVVITKNGRRWDPALHPRDANGRFIETGGTATVWGRPGEKAKVVRMVGRGRVELQFSDGHREVHQGNRLRMEKRPDGSKPVKDDGSDKSRDLVAREDERRAKDPKRGDGKDFDDLGDRDGDGVPDKVDAAPDDANDRRRKAPSAEDRQRQEREEREAAADRREDQRDAQRRDGEPADARPGSKPAKDDAARAVDDEIEQRTADLDDADREDMPYLTALEKARHAAATGDTAAAREHLDAAERARRDRQGSAASTPRRGEDADFRLDSDGDVETVGPDTPAGTRVRERGKGSQGATGTLTGNRRQQRDGWTRYEVQTDQGGTRWATFLGVLEDQDFRPSARRDADAPSPAPRAATPAERRRAEGHIAAARTATNDRAHGVAGRELDKADAIAEKTGDKDLADAVAKARDESAVARGVDVEHARGVQDAIKRLAAARKRGMTSNSMSQVASALNAAESSDPDTARQGLGRADRLLRDVERDLGIPSPARRRRDGATVDTTPAASDAAPTEGAPGERDGVRGDRPNVLDDVPADAGGVDGGRGGALPGAGRGGRGSGRDDGGADRLDAAEAGGRGGAGRGAEGGAAGGAGDRAGRDGVPAAGAGDRSPRAAVDAARGGRDGVAPEPVDYQPTGNEVPTGEVGKLRANMEALRTLRKIQDEDRFATPEEQKVLARWAGWGALGEVFNEKKPKWAKERAELRDLIPDQREWNQARENALNAHYTDLAYVKPVWDFLGEMGFRGGDVLEPGSGSGNFIGTRPPRTHVTGVELEPTTAGIAKLLYPSQTIRNEGFEESRLRRDSFDAVVGNVPFGKYPLHDPEFNAGGHSVHNHFILKSLALTKPGGLVALHTSRYTLDGNTPKARKARQEMFEQADLVGAVRLPAGAHKGTAGTTVVTDLLVFRKRKPGEEPRDAAWLDAPKTTLADGGEFNLNGYFAANPEHVLGDLVTGQGRMGRDPELSVRGDVDLVKDTYLDDVMTRMARDLQDRGVTYSPTDAVDAPERPATRPTPSHLPAYSAKTMRSANLREGAVRKSDETFKRTITHGKDGKPLKRARNEETQFTQIVGGEEVPHYLPKTQAEEFGSLVELADTFEDLLDAESRTDVDTPEIDALRKHLNDLYDAHVAKHGPIGRFEWSEPEPPDDDDADEFTEARPPRRLFPQQGGARTMPYLASVFALEGDYDPDTKTARKADVFSKRTVAKRAIAERADNPTDAATIVLESTGRLDVDDVARVMGVSPDQARRHLLDEGLAFEQPGDRDGDLMPAAEYLSGNVRARLKDAREAAEVDGGERWAKNIAALEERVPQDKTPAEIHVQLGAPWIPDVDVQEFAHAILETPMFARNTGTGVKVQHLGGSTWKVTGGTRSGVLARQTWGTDRRPFQDLLQTALTQSQVQVHDEIEGPDGSKKKVLNVEATEAAQAKAEEIAERFQEWIWEDPKRAARLQESFNALYRSQVSRSYDGSPQRAYPGMVAGWSMRQHQNDGVTRIVNEPSALLAHVVGAGKTATMQAGAMELRRLGLAKKPAHVIPNHMLEQYTREFKELYPQSNLLAVDSKVLGDPNKRRQFLARVAAGDWDSVIFTQEAFKSIPLSEENTRRYLDKELDALRGQLERAKGDGDKTTVKQIEVQVKNAEAKIKKLLDTRKDDGGVTFERMGIDYLFVDEAHHYKNLRTVSKDRTLSKPGSQKATDLDMKLDHLRSTSESGRVVTLATGTPIANSISEAYVMQRYLRPDLLDEAGITDFDSWLAMFGEKVTSVEMSVDGNSFKPKTRVAKFRNAGEMIRMWSQAADVKRADHLNLPRPELSKREDGTRGPRTVAVDRTPAQEAYITHLGERAEAVKSGLVEPEVDNMLKISSDGRKAALDMRLIDDPEFEAKWGSRDYGESPKVNAVVDSLFNRWEGSKDRQYDTRFGSGEKSDRTGGLQIVFADLGTPNSDGRFSVYDEIRDQLVARGIPRDQVRFIHEAKTADEKARLFDDANNGKVSVLIGSTEKMGTGTNVQNRALSISHLDVPWRPADLEQRDGRVIRQRNQNAEVDVDRFVTEGTFDAFMWGGVERKAGFIEQVYRGDVDADEIEDIGDAVADAAAVKAIASGNPLLVDQAFLGNELRRLRRRERGHRRSVGVAQRARRDLDDYVAELNRELGQLEDAQDRTVDTFGDNFRIDLGRRGRMTPSTKRAEAGERLGEFVEVMLNGYVPAGQGSRERIGTFGGHDVYARTVNKQGVENFVTLDLGFPGSEIGLNKADVTGKTRGQGALTRLENKITGIDSEIARKRRQIANSDREATRLDAEAAKEFRQADELEIVDRRTTALDRLLSLHDAEGEEQIAKRTEAAAAYQRATEDHDAFQAQQRAARRAAADAQPDAPEPEPEQAQATGAPEGDAPQVDAVPEGMGRVQDLRDELETLDVPSDNDRPADVLDVPTDRPAADVDDPAVGTTPDVVDAPAPDVVEAGAPRAPETLSESRSVQDLRDALDELDVPGDAGSPRGNVDASEAATAPDASTPSTPRALPENPTLDDAWDHMGRAEAPKTEVKIPPKTWDFIGRALGRQQDGQAPVGADKYTAVSLQRALGDARPFGRGGGRADLTEAEIAELGIWLDNIGRTGPFIDPAERTAVLKTLRDLNARAAEAFGYENDTRGNMVRARNAENDRWEGMLPKVEAPRREPDYRFNALDDDRKAQIEDAIRATVAEAAESGRPIRFPADVVNRMDRDGRFEELRGDTSANEFRNLIEFHVEARPDLLDASRRDASVPTAPDAPDKPRPDAPRYDAEAFDADLRRIAGELDDASESRNLNALADGYYQDDKLDRLRMWRESLAGTLESNRSTEQEFRDRAAGARDEKRRQELEDAARIRQEQNERYERTLAAYDSVLGAHDPERRAAAPDAGEPGDGDEPGLRDAVNEPEQLDGQQMIDVDGGFALAQETYTPPAPKPADPRLTEGQQTIDDLLAEPDAPNADTTPDAPAAPKQDRVPDLDAPGQRDDDTFDGPDGFDDEDDDSEWEDDTPRQGWDTSRWVLDPDAVVTTRGNTSRIVAPTIDQLPEPRESKSEAQLDAEWLQSNADFEVPSGFTETLAEDVRVGDLITAADGAQGTVLRITRQPDGSLRLSLGRPDTSFTGKLTAKRIPTMRMSTSDASRIAVSDDKGAARDLYDALARQKKIGDIVPMPGDQIQPHGAGAIDAPLEAVNDEYPRIMRGSDVALGMHVRGKGYKQGGGWSAKPVMLEGRVIGFETLHYHDINGNEQPTRGLVDVLIGDEKGNVVGRLSRAPLAVREADVPEGYSLPAPRRVTEIGAPDVDRPRDVTPEAVDLEPDRVPDVDAPAAPSGRLPVDQAERPVLLDEPLHVGDVIYGKYRDGGEGPLRIESYSYSGRTLVAEGVDDDGRRRFVFWPEHENPRRIERAPEGAELARDRSTGASDSDLPGSYRPSELRVGDRITANVPVTPNSREKSAREGRVVGKPEKRGAFWVVPFETSTGDRHNVHMSEARPVNVAERGPRDVTPDVDRPRDVNAPDAGRPRDVDAPDGDQPRRPRDVDSPDADRPRDRDGEDRDAERDETSRPRDDDDRDRDGDAPQRDEDDEQRRPRDDEDGEQRDRDDEDGEQRDREDQDERRPRDDDDHRPRDDEESDEDRRRREEEEERRRREEEEERRRAEDEEDEDERRRRERDSSRRRRRKRRNKRKKKRRNKKRPHLGMPRFGLPHLPNLPDGGGRRGRGDDTGAPSKRPDPERLDAPLSDRDNTPGGGDIAQGEGGAALGDGDGTPFDANWRAFNDQLAQMNDAELAEYARQWDEAGDEVTYNLVLDEQRRRLDGAPSLAFVPDEDLFAAAASGHEATILRAIGELERREDAGRYADNPALDAEFEAWGAHDVAEVDAAVDAFLGGDMDGAAKILRTEKPTKAEVARDVEQHNQDVMDRVIRQAFNDGIIGAVDSQEAFKDAVGVRVWNLFSRGYGVPASELAKTKLDEETFRHVWNVLPRELTERGFEHVTFPGTKRLDAAIREVDEQWAEPDVAPVVAPSRADLDETLAARRLALAGDEPFAPLDVDDVLPGDVVTDPESGAVREVVGVSRLADRVRLTLRGDGGDEYRDLPYDSEVQAATGIGRTVTDAPVSRRLVSAVHVSRDGVLHPVGGADVIAPDGEGYSPDLLRALDGARAVVTTPDGDVAGLVEAGPGGLVVGGREVPASDVQGVSLLSGSVTVPSAPMHAAWAEHGAKVSTRLVDTDGKDRDVTGRLVGTEPGGARLFREDSGRLHLIPANTPVRPHVRHAGPMQATETTGRPGVWTNPGGDAATATMPGEWTASVVRGMDGGYHWSVSKPDGGGDRGRARTLEEAKAAARDALAADGADRLPRDGGPSGWGGSPERPTDAPADLGGHNAEWVAVSGINLGETVRIYGFDQNGRDLTESGVALSWPQPVRVDVRGAGREPMYAVVVGENADGTGPRRVVFAKADAVAARAVPEANAAEDAQALTDGAESDVLNGRMPEYVPVDRAGHGLFPGTGVARTSDGRQGVVKTSSGRDVVVLWDNGTEAPIAANAVDSIDGNQTRPEGWTAGGRRVRPGAVVSWDGEAVAHVGGRTGKVAQIRGVVVGLDGDDVTVSTPAGEVTRNAADLALVSPPGVESAVTPARLAQQFDDVTRDGIVVFAPLNGEVIDVALTPESRRALASLGFDIDSVSDPALAQTAARVLYGAGTTRSDADALAAAVESARGPSTEKSAWGRSMRRLHAELLDPEARSARDRGEEEVVEPDDVVPGDRVRVDDAVVTVNETHGDTWEVTDEAGHDERIEAPTEPVTVLPDAPDQADVEPADSNAVDRGEAVTAQTVRDLTRQRVRDTADTIAEHALGDAHNASTIDDLRERVAARLVSESLDPELTAVARAYRQTLSGSGIDPDAAAEARRDALERARAAEGDVVTAIIGTINDAEPLPGETWDQTRARVVEAIRDAARLIGDDHARREEPPTRREDLPVFEGEAPIVDAADVPSTPDVPAPQRVEPTPIDAGDVPSMPSGTQDTLPIPDTGLAPIDVADIPSLPDGVQDELPGLIPDSAEWTRPELEEAARRLREIGDRHVRAAVERMIAELERATGGRPLTARDVDLLERLVRQEAARPAPRRTRAGARAVTRRGRGMEASASFRVAHWLTGLVLKVGRLLVRALRALVSRGGQEDGQSRGAMLRAAVNEFRTGRRGTDVEAPERRLPTGGMRLPMRGDGRAAAAGRFAMVRRGARSGGTPQAVVPATGERTVDESAVQWVVDRSPDRGPGRQALGQLGGIQQSGASLSGGDLFERASAARVTAEASDRAIRDAITSGNTADLATLTRLAADSRGLADRLAHEAVQHAQTATLDELRQRRDFGEVDGARLSLTGDKDAVDAVRWAAQFYPTDWLRAVGEQGITVKVGDRGEYDANTRTMTLANMGAAPGGNAYTRNALHELAHVFEDAIPDVGRAQWTYHYDRTSEGDVGHRRRTGMNSRALLVDLVPGGGHDPSEVARADSYPDPYIGREYGSMTHFEILSMAMESIFGGSEYLDQSMRQFVLGLIADLGRNEGALAGAREAVRS
ncbi:helicase-related protein [Cellulosimicrobium cellulans]|uniref:helicase-related protein n=1 Tax=Cellulosimicrobium cellulans TaxID=1710 RepID=UPI0035DFFF86